MNERYLSRGRTWYRTERAARDYARAMTEFDEMVKATKHHGAMCPCETCKKVRAA